MLLADFFERVYLPRRLRGRSENSIRLYRLCLRQFGRTLGRDPEVADLNEDNVLAHLSRRSSVAPATRNKELTELKAMWRLAAQRGLLTTWPDVQDEPEPERDPIAWTAEEVHRLLAAAEAMPGMIGDAPQRAWWPALIRLTLDTAERVGCVRQARWDWLQSEWLCVPAEARKGKTRDRRYRLSTPTVAALERLREHARGAEIFAWPYAETYLWTLYRRVVARAGLPTGRKYQLHALRKTTASAIYAAGMDPQEALDHSDRRTTAKYIDPRFSRTRQPCDVLTEWLAKPKRKRDDDQRATG